MLWDREIPKVYMTATSVRAPDAVFHPSQWSLLGLTYPPT
jgi:hypothetical protein